MDGYKDLNLVCLQLSMFDLRSRLLVAGVMFKLSVIYINSCYVFMQSTYKYYHSHNSGAQCVLSYFILITN